LPNAPAAKVAPNAAPKTTEKHKESCNNVVTLRATGVHTLKHSDEVLGLACSRDGRNLLVGGEEKTLALWDLELKSKIWTAGGLDPPVTAVAYSPSGIFGAASCGREGTVQVWNIQSRDGKCCGYDTMHGEVASLAMASLASQQELWPWASRPRPF
jgi:WD40 repeat protein